MSTIISVENLSKMYRIGTARQHNSFRDIFDERVRSFFKAKDERGAIAQNTIWALQDVSFDVQEGEVLGIIGRNGAGKSTLLKILSRITEPTEGLIRMKGRIASLLEVGTGFSGELTGRENIFLNGAILGMKKAEIKKKFDEMVAFAEIEKFIDTPVKRYSSGMYMRLAFAVAAHLEPEILIVDEVLAVGDAQFQKKCLGKMKDVGKEGRTILFVSHNMSAVSSLCNKGIVLSGGKIDFSGTSHDAISAYLISGTDSLYERKQAVKDDLPVILRAWFENEAGEKKIQFYSGEPIYLMIESENPGRIPMEVFLSFWDNLRRPLWNFTHAMHGIQTLPNDRKIRIRVAFYPPKLTISELLVDMALGPRGGAYYDHIVNAIKCTIMEKKTDTFLPRFPEWPIFCEASLTCAALNDLRE
jgi:lipopolysaccharide transport system ATP-binding protein